jgi:hypothetical protein
MAQNHIDPFLVQFAPDDKEDPKVFAIVELILKLFSLFRTGTETHLGQSFPFDGLSVSCRQQDLARLFICTW